jgi:hypothetical protein
MIFLKNTIYHLFSYDLVSYLLGSGHPASWLRQALGPRKFFAEILAGILARNPVTLSPL